MASHKQWLQQGFDEGVFLLAGSLGDGQGGGILAKGDTLETIANFVHEDPFVKENVVSPEIIPFAVSMATESMSFLMDVTGS